MRSAVGILLGVLCAAFLCGSARAADDPYAAYLAPAGTCGAAEEQVGLDPQTAELAILCFTNYARAHDGLSPLSLNATLNAAGNAKLAADISCGVFSHEPCGQPFDTVFASYTKGASAFQIGENIAWGTGSYGTPRATMNGWLHSAGHRENILTAAYAELGVGSISGQSFQGYSGATLWSQEFGVRSPTGANASATATKPVAKPAAKPAPQTKHRRRVHRRLRAHT
jgi:uncharacterized protein YkwD